MSWGSGPPGRGGVPPPPVVGPCCPLVGLILLVLLVFRWFCLFFAGFGGLVGAAPSAPLWLWAPLGADFVHFVCFSLVLGGWWGLRPLPLCGCGPLWGLISFILFVFRWFWGAGGGCALCPSVVVGPF